jgi:hypothetical protein
MATKKQVSVNPNQLELLKELQSPIAGGESSTYDKRTANSLAAKGLVRLTAKGSVKLTAAGVKFKVA